MQISYYGAITIVLLEGIITECRMIRARPGRSWVKLSSLVALGYYALGLTTLLLGYLSESDKLSRGMHTDTFNPLMYSELVTWPSSAFVASWPGYPERFSQVEWQKVLNDSIPSHLWAVVMQTSLLLLLMGAVGTALGRRGSKA